MNIYYVVPFFEYEGDYLASAKVFLSHESAEAYKAHLEAIGEACDGVDIRHMFAEAWGQSPRLWRGWSDTVVHMYYRANADNQFSNCPLKPQ